MRSERRVGGFGQPPLAKKVDSSAYVIRARVARIDPPVRATLNRQRPTVINFQNVATSALLNVLNVYKGPPMSTIEVALPGSCFSPTDCTLLPMQYQWRDVVGYDLILFLVAIPPPPSGVSALPAQAGPFLTYVVNPNPTKDDVLFINAPSPVHQSLSQLEAAIRAAPIANH